MACWKPTGWKPCYIALSIAQAGEQDPGAAGHCEIQQPRAAATGEVTWRCAKEGWPTLGCIPYKRLSKINND